MSSRQALVPLVLDTVAGAAPESVTVSSVALDGLALDIEGVGNRRAAATFARALDASPYVTRVRQARVGEDRFHLRASIEPPEIRIRDRLRTEDIMTALGVQLFEDVAAGLRSVERTWATYPFPDALEEVRRVGFLSGCSPTVTVGAPSAVDGFVLGAVRIDALCGYHSAAIFADRLSEGDRLLWFRSFALDSGRSRHPGRLQAELIVPQVVASASGPALESAPTYGPPLAERFSYDPSGWRDPMVPAPSPPPTPGQVAPLGRGEVHLRLVPLHAAVQLVAAAWNLTPPAAAPPGFASLDGSFVGASAMAEALGAGPASVDGADLRFRWATSGTDGAGARPIAKAPAFPDQYVLVGCARGTQEAALLATADGTFAVVAIGSTVGRNEGNVTAIGRGGVEVIEVFHTLEGEAVENKILIAPRS